MKQNPWFRFYTEAIDDHKLRLLAFEDRWHFVALLCCKGQGILDNNPQFLQRSVAVKLGVQVRELEEIARRLSEVGLIDAETLQPVAWDERQFVSDSSKERTRAWRDRKKRHSDVTVTLQETETDTETDIKTNTRKARFTAPTIEQVQAYCIERQNNVNAEHFVDHYTANGWKVGKNAMKDWKAAIRTWEKRNETHQHIDTRSRAKRVSDKLDAIAKASIEREIAAGTLDSGDFQKIAG